MSAAVKLACEHVWKLFGPEPERFLAAHNHRPGPEDLAAAGLIGAVRDASLAIRTGEIFVIMGLSGSGKSTLVRCMSRLVEPSAGRILFEDEDLLAVSDARLIEIRRHKMGMVFQHFALLPHLTVLGNVAFPLEVQGVERARRELRRRGGRMRAQEPLRLRTEELPDVLAGELDRGAHRDHRSQGSARRPRAR